MTSGWRRRPGGAGLMPVTTPAQVTTSPGRIARSGVERVADGDEALPLELLRTVRPHALHVLQRRRESDGRARLPALGHRGIKPAGSRPFATRLRRSAIRLEE